MNNLHLIARREATHEELASDIFAITASLLSGVTLLLTLAVAF